jgi:molecular chaperone GrpE
MKQNDDVAPSPGNTPNDPAWTAADSTSETASAGPTTATTAQADGDDGSSAQQAPEGERVQALQSEMSTLQDRHLRLAAEYDNYRKRSERERSESWGRAQGDIVKRLLDVLDDLQRVAHYDEATTTVHALHEGVELVEKKLRTLLENSGLETVDAEGKVFDPTTMEALMTAPTDERAEDEHVADVFQKGYRFQNTLLRPARVRVKKFEG